MEVKFLRWLNTVLKQIGKFTIFGELLLAQKQRICPTYVKQHVKNSNLFTKFIQLSLLWQQ
jgi:hypothetical protein